ncbi:MAG: hypothetical protein WCS37_07395 [Chloroflexota bacterium]|nr:hypothetical protein [Chloroflexota bacterium]
MDSKLSNSAGRVTTKDQADIIPAVTTRHRRFVSISSIAFAALYAELMFFAYNYYGSGLTFETVALAVGGVFVMTLVGLWVSFSLPHRLYRARFEQYSPIIFLVTEWTASIMIIVAITLLTLGVGIFLVGGNLGAVGELLRSLALYAIVAVVSYHGLVTFVRYVHYLYERELHQSYKVVTVAGVSVVVLLLITLYLLQYDLGRMGGSEPHQDLLSFHLSLRDIWLIVMNMYVLFWHYSRLADH